METQRRFGLTEGLLLLAIVSGAFAMRAWFLLVCADGGRGPAPVLVQDDAAGQLDPLVRNLAEYRWYGNLAPFAAVEERTAHVSPGYPWLLGWLELSPIDLRPIDQTVRWLQCALGAMTAGLYMLFAWYVFPSRLVAGLTGVLCALNPFWIVSIAQVADGVLATFLLGACLYLAVQAVQGAAPLTSLLLGLSLAALALARAALLPFAVVLLLWYLWRCRNLRGAWLGALVAFLGFLTGLMPWTLRNWQAFHDVYPIVNSTYYHMWMGTNPDTTGGTMTDRVLAEALSHSRRFGGTPGLTAERIERNLGQLSQGERFRELGRASWEEVGENPTAALRGHLSAAIYFFTGQGWFFTQGLSAGQGSSGPYWFWSALPGLLTASLLATLTLAFLGWRWSFAWRQASRPATLALLWVPLPYLLGHAEWWSGPRLPLDGVLACFAAFAIACAVPPVGRRLFRGEQEPSDDKEKG